VSGSSVGQKVESLAQITLPTIRVGEWREGEPVRVSLRPEDGLQRPDLLFE
jgi:hypothetical protein